MTAPISGWSTPICQWELWMHSANKPATTITLRTYHLRRFAYDHRDRDPWSITLDDLATWLGSHLWAPETMRSYRASLRVFYGWAHVTGRIPVNPSGLLPSITPPRGRPRPAPEDIFLDAIAGARDPRVQLMLELAGRLAMRRGEISRARADDLETDADGPIMRVRGKGRVERIVPVVNEALVARLRQWPHRGYLFPGRIDGHLSPAYVGKLMSHALEAHWTAHSLRHRAAGRFYLADRDIRAVQELLGHASVRTTQIYTPVPTGALRAAVAAAA